MPQHELPTMTFIADRLRVAQFRGVKDVIHHLLLSQILLDHLQDKLAASTAAVKSALSGEQAKPAVFCPEVVSVMGRMMQLAVPGEATCTTTGLLVLQDSMTAVQL